MIYYPTFVFVKSLCCPTLNFVCLCYGIMITFNALITSPFDIYILVNLEMFWHPGELDMLSPLSLIRAVTENEYRVPDWSPDIVVFFKSLFTHDTFPGADGAWYRIQICWVPLSISILFISIKNVSMANDVISPLEQVGSCGSGKETMDGIKWC
jgi:hypothetical protein